MSSASPGQFILIWILGGPPTLLELAKHLRHGYHMLRTSTSDREGQHGYNPATRYYGKIIKTVLGAERSANLVWIESLDEGYKGLTKSVLLEQIIRIEDDL